MAEADEARLAVAAAQRQAAEVAAQLAHSRSEIELYTQEIEVGAMSMLTYLRREAWLA